MIATYTTLASSSGCTEVGDGTDWQNPSAPAASGCGPFTRGYTYRLWAPGDTFLVYPAVYTGDLNQPWIGPAYDDYADYLAGISHAPDGITLQGVVQNNTRPVILLTGYTSNNTLGQGPVYFDQSNGFKMDSIDVRAGANALAGKAGVYNVGGSNLTLSNMRISGFAHAGGVNGLFGAGNYSGSLTLEGVELDHNGGVNGPAHNAYIGASVIDPAYTVNMSHSWSHHAYYGHLFKSRAQVNVFTANFFQGGVPWYIYTQAENYLLDIPNGGLLTARNNVFVKNMSAYNSNAMSVTFALEGFSDNRPQGLDLENNTFVAFSKTYDGFHQLYPMAFFYPNVVPSDPAWPSGIPGRVIKNVFVGYCPTGGNTQDYRGDISATEAFSELSHTYTIGTKVEAPDDALAPFYNGYVPVIGTPAYIQQLQTPLMRAKPTVGAED